MQLDWLTDSITCFIGDREKVQHGEARFPIYFRNLPRHRRCVVRGIPPQHPQPLVLCMSPSVEEKVISTLSCSHDLPVRVTVIHRLVLFKQSVQCVNNSADPVTSDVLDRLDAYYLMEEVIILRVLQLLTT